MRERGHGVAVRRGRAVITACAAALVLAVVVATAANATPRGAEAMHGMRVHDAKPTSKSSGGNLVDHGGPVLNGARLYAIWWGAPSAFPSDAQSGLGSFLGGFGSSTYLQIAQQYMRGASLTASFAQSYYDSSAPPNVVNSTSTIANEIQKVLNGTAPDANGIYVVFTSNFPRGANYCAWHSGANVNGVAIAQAYIPNTTGVSGCAVSNTNPPNAYSAGTRSMANVTAHELMEAVTDKLPGGATTAWVDAAGSEIGDKCAWKFGSAVTIGSVGWQLQKEWSNAVSGCVS